MTYRYLRATIPLKVQIVEEHIIEFIDIKDVNVFGMINNLNLIKKKLQL